MFVGPTQPLLYAVLDRPNPTAYDYLDPFYTTADVDRIIAASDAEIQQASETMPFEQFATQTASEGDQCAPLLGGEG